MEVPGTKPRTHPRLWLDGREQDLQILDEEVESHKEMDRRARVNREIEVVGAARKALRTACKRKRQKLKSWEKDDWEELRKRAPRQHTGEPKGSCTGY